MPKKKLPAVPEPAPPKRATKPPAKSESAAAPDLSHILEALRPLAVPVGELTFDPANARTHDERNLDAIKGSLAIYKQRKPIVIRREGNVVIAGNGTLQAALSLGWTHLAAVYVEDDAATAAGFSIADNRSAELGGWDQAALDKLLREVNTANDPRLDAMLSELAMAQGIIPADTPAPAATQPAPEATPCPTCGRALPRSATPDAA